MPARERTGSTRRARQKTFRHRTRRLLKRKRRTPNEIAQAPARLACRASANFLRALGTIDADNQPAADQWFFGRFVRSADRNRSEPVRPRSDWRRAFGACRVAPKSAPRHSKPRAGQGSRFEEIITGDRLSHRLCTVNCRASTPALRAYADALDDSRHSSRSDRGRRFIDPRPPRSRGGVRSGRAIDCFQLIQPESAVRRASPTTGDPYAYRYWR